MSTYVRNKVSTAEDTKSTSTKVTTTNVATSSVVICAANPDRKGLFIWNNSSNSGYVAFALTATSAGPTFIQATFSTYTMTMGTIWTGAVSAIRNAGTGNMVVWELL